MKRSVLSVLCAVCIVAPPMNSFAEQQENRNVQPQTEENCRNAISAGLEMLQRLPPDLNQRDDEARKKLLTEMKQLVETNRRQGVSECRTWTEMMGRAFNQ